MSHYPAVFGAVSNRDQVPAIVNLNGLQQEMMLVGFRKELSVATGSASIVACGVNFIGPAVDRRRTSFADGTDRLQMGGFRRGTRRCRMFVNHLIESGAGGKSGTMSRSF